MNERNLPTTAATANGDGHDPIRTPQSAIRNSLLPNPAIADIDYDALLERVPFHFALDRRSFVQMLGAGVLVTAVGVPAWGQRRGGGGFRGGPPPALSARIHFGDDGVITVLSGKVDGGQGSRSELAQAAAEELRMPLGRVRMLLADTSVVPNDGSSAGSRTTPSTVPAVRQASAAMRQLLVAQAAETWGVEPGDVEAKDGKLRHEGSDRSLSYAEVAQSEALADKLAKQTPADAKLTPVENWQVLGQAARPPAGPDKVLGRHEFPSDIRRPGMMYGRVLRPEKYRAQLEKVELDPAQAMDGVIVVQDGPFVGVAAANSFAAGEAIEAIAKTAKWKAESMPDSGAALYDHLREQAAGGVPPNPFRDEVERAQSSLRATYTTAYVQHAPLEPRTAVAEWEDGKLTVWTATQNPFGVRGELARAFRLPEESVRVVVPDFGSAYGGKHTGESAVEAARLAKAAKKPVMLRWTREEEFTWAYFRPAAVIDLQASLDGEGRITSWWHLNINSGGSSIDSPYRVAKKQSDHVDSRPPLRHGAYRALASTANSFARESFMDELAHAAEADPFEFRRAHLDDPRLRAVLEEAGKRFDWANRKKNKEPNRGVGVACSLDKGSYVACCAEVEVDRTRSEIHVRHVCEAFDCGPVMNPDNLRNQVEGAIIQGLGPALREEMQFAGGQITNASFVRYRVPHFKDVPTVDVHLMDRPEVEAAGAGETPIIVIAPAVANAVFDATGIRLRAMPLDLAKPGDART